MKYDVFEIAHKLKLIGIDVIDSHLIHGKIDVHLLIPRIYNSAQRSWCYFKRYYNTNNLKV